MAIICTTVASIMDSSSTGTSVITSGLPCSFPFGPPTPPSSSTTCNYMTTEEVKEFMLNEQKVCVKREND